MANRAELEQALSEGCTVEVNGRRVVRAKDLPPEPAEGTGPPVEGVVMYDASGTLTRAGMEYTIRSGGSVLLRDGKGDDMVISRIQDLPEEAEVAAGNEKRLTAHTQALDAQIAHLSAERSRASEAAEKARQRPAPAPVTTTSPAASVQPAKPSPVRK